MVELKYINGGNMHHHGAIPLFLSTLNPKSAKEQLHDSYPHGGGWQPFDGFTLQDDNSLKYPGDPKLLPRVEMTLRDEKIFIYDFAWVCVVQPDRSYEVCRMD